MLGCAGSTVGGLDPIRARTGRVINSAGCAWLIGSRCAGVAEAARIAFDEVAKNPFVVFGSEFLLEEEQGLAHNEGSSGFGPASTLQCAGKTVRRAASC